LAGEGCALHADAVSFNPAEHKSFPEFLESSEKFSIRFFDFEDVGQSEVPDAFDRLHIEGKREEDAVGRLKWSRRRIPIGIMGSRDALLFRMGATANLQLSAKVTVTVSTFDRSIERFTLVSLIDREGVRRQLETVVSQERLPLMRP
jgi:hypothetical protein